MPHWNPLGKERAPPEERIGEASAEGIVLGTNQPAARAETAVFSAERRETEEVGMGKRINEESPPQEAFYFQMKRAEKSAERNRRTGPASFLGGMVCVLMGG